jgi:hypothetical protein
MGIEGTGIMYLSYTDCAEVIIDVLRSCGRKPLTSTDEILLTQKLLRTLRVDTDGNVGRADFLTRDRLINTIKDTGFMTTRIAVKDLFNQTWTAISVYL